MHQQVAPAGDHGLNRFLKMQGVERVLLGGLDFMSLAGIQAQDLAQHDPLSEGDGAQRLGRPAALEAI